MKSWALAAIFVSAAALAACEGTSESDGSGGGGGEGGSTATTTGTTGTTTGTTGTTGTTTTTGTGACVDMAGGACFDEDPATDDCGSCALAGPCAALFTTCTMNAECVALDGCLGACADQACADQCYVDHAAGEGDYTALLTCVICDTCPTECDAAGSGC